MGYNHGIGILENPTSITPPINSGTVQVVIGTAPVNLAKDIVKAVNTPILANSFKEAVELIGYSDDWEKYSLCQSMDATFRVFNVAPIVFINVLDPNTHKAEVADESISIADQTGKIDVEGVLLDTVVAKSSDGVTTYEKNTDYTADFDEEGKVIINVLENGSIGSASSIMVNYDKLDTTKVTENDIIGGYDSSKNEYKGLEVIGQIYPKLGLVPSLVTAPGWSHKPVVGAILNAKCEKINGSFNADNVLDIDCKSVTSYQDAPAWKNTNSYTSNRTSLCYPKGKLGSKVYWMSALVSALMAYTDANSDNVPDKSPSNKNLRITATVLDDGTEIFLDQTQANFLNGNGIITAININGWKCWGNNTAAYPGTTDVKDRFIPVRRMFDWWGNNFILSYFSKVDDPGNYRLIENVVDSENMKANGYKAAGKIAGAKIEFRKEDNPITNILNGRIQFLQKLAMYIPAEYIVNVLEFDPTMLESALFGGE